MGAKIGRGRVFPYLCGPITHSQIKKLTVKILNFILATLVLPLAMSAQNTIGGKKSSVPEEEVKRQSAFLSAESLRLLGKYDKAVEAYKTFTYDNPDIDAGWYGLSRSYTATKEYEKALETVAKAITLAPDNRWYYVYQADLYKQLGRPKDAIAVYESLTRRFAEVPAFYQELAYLYVLNNDPRNGLKALDRLENLTGVTEETVSKKHLIFMGLGDKKKAGDELAKLVKAYPKDLQYRHDLAEFYEKEGDAAAARRVYEEILRRDPNDPIARLAVIDKSKNSTDVAYLAGLKPLFSDPKVSIDQKVKALLPYFEKMTKGNDAVLASSLLDLGNSLETAHPDDPKAWSLSGDIAYFANRPEDALAKYRRCIQLNPRVFSVWENTLSILATGNNPDELLRVSEQAMDAFPNQPRAYYYNAVALLAKGKHQDAISSVDQATLMSGGNPALRLELGDLRGGALIGKKDYAAAVACYEGLLPKGGDQNPNILEHYGDALFLTGKETQAVEQWKKANSLRRSDALERKIANKKM
jgi:tetratricopeptide (TPR) repeat protein